MGIIHRLECRRAIRTLTRDLPHSHQRCLAILLECFTDERLESLKSAIVSGRYSGGSSIDDSHSMLSDSIDRMVSKGSLDDVTTELKGLIRIRKIINKQHDPEGTRYPAAHNMAPNDIIAFANLFLDSKTPVTTEQKHGILAVSFLTRRDEVGIGYGTLTFYPELRRDITHNTVTDQLTQLILESPGSDPDAYAQAYLSRLERRVTLEHALDDDLQYFDNMCDYPDAFIDYLAQIKAEKNTHAWRDIKELTLREGMTPESLEDLLRVSEPLLGVYNLHHMRLVLQTVDRYPEMQHSESIGSPHYRKQREALFNVTLALELETSESSPSYLTDLRIDDQRLIDLIIENPECGTAVVSAITQLQHYDYNQVKVALDAGVLGGGAL